MAYHLIDNRVSCPVIILTESDAEDWLDRKFPPGKYCQDIPTKKDAQKAARKKKMYAEEDKKLARELRAERTAYIKLHEAKLGVRETTHTREVL